MTQRARKQTAKATPQSPAPQGAAKTEAEPLTDAQLKIDGDQVNFRTLGEDAPALPSVGALIAEEIRHIYRRDARGVRPEDEERLLKMADNIDATIVRRVSA